MIRDDYMPPLGVLGMCSFIAGLLAWTWTGALVWALGGAVALLVLTVASAMIDDDDGS